MVKLIQKSGFIKPGKAAGYLKYIATRDGVEKIGPEGYLEYMAERPGSHGLFGSRPAEDLAAAMRDAQQHTGPVWTFIYSLHREDAARLGFDNAQSWRNLIKAHQVELATAMKISPEQFRWYAAYHDAGEHPHIHMTVWSDDPKQGFLTPDGIKAMRSALTNSIFQDDLYSLYQRKDVSYKELTTQARASLRELAQQMENCICDNPTIEMQMLRLSKELGSSSGKKVYHHYVMHHIRTAGARALSSGRSISAATRSCTSIYGSGKAGAFRPRRSASGRSKPSRSEVWPLDKIMRAYTYKGNGTGIEYLDLPAMPYELLDTLEKARPEEGDTVQFFVEEVYSFDFLFKHLEGSYALSELNALAEKLAELDERVVTALAGLVQMDEEKQKGSIGLPRLIDLAHSTDRCHVVDEALNDAQLGRFCAENGFSSGLDDLPGEIFDLLDFERIGREFRREQNGVLVERTADHPGGYVQRHDELREMHKYLDLRLKKPDYTILAETSSGCEIKFPHPPNDPVGTEPVRCADCAAPSLIGLTAGMETVDLLARRLAGMEPQELTAYKALLEAVDCKDLSDAERLVDSLEEYIFTPLLNSPEEVAGEELGVILCEESVPQLIPYVDLRGYGQALLEQRGGVLTPYGLLEREDGQPIHSMNEQPEPGGMEMRF